MSSNPLLAGDALPAFDRIRPEYAEPAIDAVLAQNRAQLPEVLAAGAATWDSLADPLEEMSDRLARVWSSIGHLWAVRNDDEWRRAYAACLPKVTAYGLELAQSEPLYRAYQALAAAPG
ncbi:MAG TPA: oligopeptidase A, partial [Candidatus Binatia bacterium]|nr:oligopeptidase A [Candidatus Binatia bacterium]